MDTANAESPHTIATPPIRRSRILYIVTALLLLFVIGFLVMFSMAAWAARSFEFRTGTNLKQCALILLKYTDEKNDGYREYLPSLSSRPGQLMFEKDDLYPDYISDAGMLISPADPRAEELWAVKDDPDLYFENSSYFYLGYRVWNDTTVLAFVDAYKKRIAQGLPFDSDLPAALPTTVLKRMDIGIYRQMISDADADKPEWEFLKHSDSKIPLMIEKPHPYPGPRGLFLLGPVPLSKPQMGGCVVYLDGHAEFIQYPGKWPMTQTTITALKEIAAMKLPTTSRAIRDI